MWGEAIAAAAAIVVAIIELIAARDRRHTKKLVEESRTRAERREKESRLSMDLMSATCRLSCDTAKAVRDGHTNGTLAGNLEKAEAALTAYDDFIRQEAAHAVAKQ